MMPLFAYLLRSALVGAFLLLWYLIALRNSRLHRYNRFYLLATVVLSLLLPVVHLQWHVVAPASVTAVKLLRVVAGNVAQERVVGVTSSSIHWSIIAVAVYTVVAAVLLLPLLYSVYKLFRRAKGARVQGNGVRVVHIPGCAPHSFFNTLFWNSDIAMDSDAGGRILMHEMAHIRQRHSIDKVVLSVLCAMFWANPILWLIRHELGMIHEFLADEAAVEDNDTTAFSLMLLHAHTGGRTHAIVHSFFHSPIKRRLIMLRKNSTKRFARLRATMALPIAALAVGLCSFSFVHRPAPVSGKGMVVVIDAGHGGSDIGGTGIGGVQEKDLCLAITTEMQRLAPEYGIVAIPTRAGDDYPPLPDRAGKSAIAHASAFVSVHINKNMPGEPAHNGYEVYVSKKNSHYTNSRLLASAVMQSLDPGKASLKEKGLVVLKDNTAPAILIECGNIDNAADVAIITDRSKLEKMCRQVLSGIASYNSTVTK